MQDAYNTHIDFHKEFAKGQRWQAKVIERREMVADRDRFYAAFHLLFSAQLIPLRASFLQDALSSVNKVIEFLEIDIPAFRCGYEKEWYLTKLKSVPLTLEQRDRLKSSALGLVSNPHYRREFRDWGRLMIVLADEPFVANLRTLSNSPEHFIQQNARRMLKTVLDNRRDLSSTARSGDV
jgi:FMN phosphatase YigB (HAD superfamily)